MATYVQYSVVRGRTEKASHEKKLTSDVDGVCHSLACRGPSLHTVKSHLFLLHIQMIA